MLGRTYTLSSCFRFGYSDTVSQLLAVPPYVTACEFFACSLGRLHKLTFCVSHRTACVRNLVRSYQDAVPFHLSRAFNVPCWFCYQYIQRHHGCEILRYLSLHIRLVRSFPWHSILVHPSFDQYVWYKTDLNHDRLGNNLAGQYKRGVGMALHIGIGNFAGGTTRIQLVYIHD